MENQYFLIYFYVPESHCDSVKEALFTAGAGNFGRYDKACWQTLGLGQFRPLEGANPHIGQMNLVEQIPEYKVEIICHQDKLQACKAALLNAHPYEMPAYQIIPFF